MEPRRDPEDVVSALSRMMLRCPHLRVGQAITNALITRSGAGMDPFYVDDFNLARSFDNYRPAESGSGKERT